jgi:hypothetical protein
MAQPTLTSLLTEAHGRLELVLADLSPMIDDAELERAEYTTAGELSHELARTLRIERALLPLLAQRTLLVRPATVLGFEHAELERRLGWLLDAFKAGKTDSVRAHFRPLAELIRGHARRTESVLPLLDDVIGPDEGCAIVAQMQEVRT